MNQLAHLFISVSIAQFLYCFGPVCYCCHHFFIMCDGGSDEILVVKMYFFCETFNVGGFYVASMCLLVLR